MHLIDDAGGRFPDGGRRQVLIAGGGPCGLMLAIELGRRGIGVLLVDEKASTAFNPQANATQARTMEHYRRLGFADQVRRLGLPADHPTDIAYFTRFSGHELARLSLPAAADAHVAVRTMGSDWSAAELPHRVSQKFVEAVLRTQAEACAGVEVRYGWRLTALREHAGHVEAELESADGSMHQTVNSDYLVGCDGARSLVRSTLGFGYTGDGAAERDFMGGRMHAIYLRAPDFHRRVAHPKAWMYNAFNADRRCFMASVDGHSEFAFHTQLHPGEQDDEISDDRARAMFFQAAGQEMPIEMLSRGSWRAGYALVADGYGRGRVFIGGDAAHLFTPAGGLGYNTAIEDAVNLGWKLASVLNGVASPALLAHYQTERQPAAQRNTAYARQFADSLGLFRPAPQLEDDGDAGARARAEAGAYLQQHLRREFNIPGITFGTRYDASPIIVGDGSAPPPDAPNTYVQTACPGGRAPHAWIAARRSLFDSFGFDWTLLSVAPDAAPAAALRRLAGHRRIGLHTLAMPSDEVRDLYGADHVLIRPDQVVAWRDRGAGAGRDAERVWSQVLPPPGVAGTA
jgi:2-polyprenyl-6-methoxyphenol hydroxylase-like FAD-dependent oxidoreductase